MVVLLAACGACAEPTGEPAPLFVRPFTDDHPVTNFFDHGSTGKDRSLMRDGRLAWGLQGHHAYDFGMPEGTELFAMADGRVLRAGDQGAKRCPGGGRAGTSIELRVLHEAPDGRTWVTDWRHLSEVRVGKGDTVRAGQLVARSGNTGCSSGPHLHLEVYDAEHRPVDPYGWAGNGPDPWPGSAWLWKDGQAPPLRRSARGPAEKDAAFGPHRMVGTDSVDPIGGEWVDVGVRETARAPWTLRGYALANAAGDRFALPDVTLAPGQSLRVFTSRAEPGPGAVSLGRTGEAWNDVGDCVRLLDPAGTVRATLPFGRDRCP